jgi:hypothetical protein
MQIGPGGGGAEGASKRTVSLKLIGMGTGGPVPGVASEEAPTKSSEGVQRGLTSMDSARARSSATGGDDALSSRGSDRRASAADPSQEANKRKRSRDIRGLIEGITLGGWTPRDSTPKDVVRSPRDSLFLRWGTGTPRDKVAPQAADTGMRTRGAAVLPIIVGTTAATPRSPRQVGVGRGWVVGGRYHGSHWSLKLALLANCWWLTLLLGWGLRRIVCHFAFSDM